MSTIENLLEIMARLRSPNDGCPWDTQQSFATIAAYTIEEAYEVADAIARDDLDDLCNELGDLLFQVVFHAQMAEEAGKFDFSAVVTAICEKMVRRHPHVFGTAEEREKGATPGSWERIKAEEREKGALAGSCERIKAEERGAKPAVANSSVLDGIAINLPALKMAEKLGKRASSAGFDWPDISGVKEKISEEFAELEDACHQAQPAAIKEELGDLLFSIVNLARHLNVDPEQALTDANRKFAGRFRGVERAAEIAQTPLKSLDLEALETLWQAQKPKRTE